MSNVKCQMSNVKWALEHSGHDREVAGLKLRGGEAIEFNTYSFA